jgi:hypothetical protein
MGSEILALTKSYAGWSNEVLENETIKATSSMRVFLIIVMK